MSEFAAPKEAMEAAAEMAKSHEIPFSREEVILLSPDSERDLKLVSGASEEQCTAAFLNATKENVGKFYENSGSIAFIPQEGIYGLVAATDEHRQALADKGYESGSLGVISLTNGEIKGNPAIEAQYSLMHAQVELEFAKKTAKSYFPELDISSRG